MTTTQLLNWLLLSTLSLGALWLLYHVALRRERCFQYNRGLLLLAPVLAAGLPLLPLPTPWLSAVPAAAQASLHLLPSVTVGATAATASALTALPWLLIFYGSGVALLLAQLSWQLGRLWRFTRTLPAEPHPGYTLRRTGGQRPTGSFGRTVFWDDSLPLTAAEAAQVLRHELVHVRQRHTLDRLWLRVWQAVLWPNPFVHLLPRALDLTHEYLADAAVAPAAPTAYVRLLARQATGWLGQAPTLAHSFFSSSTLTRIAMLNRSSVPRRWKQWLALPVCAGLLFVVACEKNTPADEAVAPQAQTQESKEASSIEIQRVPGSSKFILLADGKQVGGEYNKDEVVPALRQYRSSMPASSRPPRIIRSTNQASSFPPPPIVQNVPPHVVRNAKGEIIHNYVEQMPEPQGGMGGLLKYIGENIRYPEASIATKLEGKVFVSFTINKEGAIEDVYLRKGISSPEHAAAAQAMNEEAMRVVRELPRWTPGKQDGQLVNVSYTIPVSYALEE